MAISFTIEIFCTILVIDCISTWVDSFPDRIPWTALYAMVSVSCAFFVFSCIRVSISSIEVDISSEAAAWLLAPSERLTDESSKSILLSAMASELSIISLMVEVSLTAINDKESARSPISSFCLIDSLVLRLPLEMFFAKATPFRIGSMILIAIK